jgi:hypothetical protein
MHPPSGSFHLEALARGEIHELSGAAERRNAVNARLDEILDEPLDQPPVDVSAAVDRADEVGVDPVWKLRRGHGQAAPPPPRRRGATLLPICSQNK